MHILSVKYLRNGTLALIAMLLLSAVFVGLGYAHLAGAPVINAPFGTTPTVDGSWDFWNNEWADAPQYSLTGTGGYFRVKHDGFNLYVIIDLLNEPAHSSGCHFVYLDPVHDGSAGTSDDVTLHCCTEGAFGTGMSPNNPPNDWSHHRISELVVPLASLGFTDPPNQLPATVGFYIGALSETYGVLYEWPPGAGGSYAWFGKGAPSPDNWGDLTIAQPPIVLQPPVASHTCSNNKPAVGELVTCDASASSDPDGTITSYAWTFGDGNTGSGMIVTHTYTALGPYTCTLTVTDNDAQSDTEMCPMVVKEDVWTMPAPIDNHYSPSSPTIDGLWTSSGEWADASMISMSYGGLDGCFRVKNNGTHLLVLVEFCSDTVWHSWDAALIGLDTLNNGGTTPGTDDYIYHNHNIWQGTGDPANPWTGGHAFPEPGAMNNGTSPCHPGVAHQINEFSIAWSDIGVTPPSTGKTVTIGLYVFAGDWNPANMMTPWYNDIIEWPISSCGIGGWWPTDPKTGSLNPPPERWGDMVVHAAKSANLVRRSAWPEHHHYSIARDEDANQTLYGKAKNLGSLPVMVKVEFTIKDPDGIPVLTIATQCRTLQPGEIGDFTADLSPQLGKWRVDAQAYYDTDNGCEPTCICDPDADPVVNNCEDTGAKIKSFSFAVVL